MERLKTLSINYEFDFICLTEVNKDWRAVRQEHTIWNGTAGWMENRRVQISANSTKPTKGEVQVGGTAMIAFNNLVHNTSGQGYDSRRLGRWSFISITGKNGFITTFITCYCPVISTSPGSAYSQHLVYMAENEGEIPSSIKCPRQLFGQDLREFINEKITHGHQLVISGDFNSGYNELKNWFLDEGLKDIMAERHGKSPITYQRSASDPIDCIFASPSMFLNKGGCLGFNRLISDHRGLWIDIPNELIYGYNPPPVQHPNARRLKIKDPRVVDKYLNMLHKECTDNKLYELMDTLHSKVVPGNPLPPTLIKEFETLDRDIDTNMAKCEEKCRKLQCGAVPWSPTYRKVNMELDYWRMRQKYILGIHHNVRQLIVLQNKLNIKYDASISQQNVKKKIRECAKRRKHIKK